MTADKKENNVDEILPVDEPKTEDIVSEAKNSNEKETQGEKQDEEPEWIDLLGSGSIMKKIVKEGKSDTKPQRLENCTLKYELTLEDGTVVEKVDELQIQLGDCEVIQGLDLAIGLMNSGERCILKIAPRLAFGSIGLKPSIPPEATVVYDIELVSFEHEDDMEVLSIFARKEKGNKKKERGNWWYGRNENSLAIQCYRRALDFLDEVEGGLTSPSNKEEITDATLQSLLEDRVSVCNNMAAAQIKLELYDAALNSLQTVLRYQPNNVKALFRKAKVHRAKNDLPASLKCLRKADEVSPNNADVQKELAQVTKLIQKQKVTEKELAKRMFGGDRAANKEVKKKESKTNFLVWSATLAASFAVGLVGMAAYRLKFA